MKGIIVAGNAGVFTTTAGNDLLHQLPTNRSARLWKIMCYNNTGGNVTLQFGTLNNAAAFVALLPLFVAINGFDNTWSQADIPDEEWRLDSSAGAAGRTGDIYVLASAAAVTVAISVMEIMHNPHFTP